MQLSRTLICRRPLLSPPPPARLHTTNAFRLPRSRKLASSADSAPSVTTQQGVIPNVKQLQQQMAEAVEVQDFVTAAALRDRLQTLGCAATEDVLRLQMSAAIAAERFAEAARLRDEIKSLQPSCTSDVVTNGIRISASSRFERVQASSDSTQAYMFVYTIDFKNESERTVKLLDREWTITDATGMVRRVRGPGVVGRTPVLEPGATYRYQSACPLETGSGSMSGHFGFADAATQDEGVKWLEPYKVYCGEFALRVES